MTPRQHAIAYKVWAHCEPIGWDCTAHECAEAIGESASWVGRVARLKGWATRFRVSQTDHNDFAWRPSSAKYGFAPRLLGFDQ
jgi:hypothetical protein